MENNKYDVCGFDKEDALNDLYNMTDLEKAYIDEINYVIETLVNDEFFEDKDAILELDENDVKDIANMMLEDNELNECLNSTIEYYLKHRIGANK